MKIFHAAAELFPFIKVGGLSDMLASISKCQAEEHEVHVAIPLLSVLRDKVKFTDIKFEAINPNEDYGSDACKVLRASQFLHAYSGKVNVYFFDSPVFANYHQVYSNSDELFSFAIFSYACHHLARVLDADIVHCHDWHTSLISVLNESLLDVKPTVFTIHNLAYQGDHPYWMTGFLRLDPFHIHTEKLDNLGKVNYMKGALLYSDEITTVSQGYSHEILHEPAGCYLAWLLNKRIDSFTGILNGIDQTEWDPAFDKKIYFNFNVDSVEKGKLENKIGLYEEYGLYVDIHRPLIGLIGRLTYQKGFETFLKAFRNRQHLPFYYFLLGTGDFELERAFLFESHYNNDRFCFYRGFNESLARKIEAASDFFVMPSLFEPCGLNQLYSHVNGSIPIVSRVGGLKDSIDESLDINFKTGIVFEPGQVDSLEYALERASSLYYNKPELERVRKNIMNLDWSWKKSNSEYMKIYDKAIKKRVK